MDAKTITYDEKVNGWTSFHSFKPDWMTSLNNRFFSIKNGQLWLHNSEEVPRNSFYGVTHPSRVKIVFNDGPSMDKIFKAINLEGDRPWDIKLKTNLSESTIKKEEFQKRESRYFAFTRGNENQKDTTSFSTIGIGNIDSYTGLNVVIIGALDNVTANDNLMQSVGGVDQIIGQIDKITGNVITLVSIQNAPSPGSFCYAKKVGRIEGGAMRGYFMEAELENNDTEKIELFSVGSKIAKSYV